MTLGDLEPEVIFWVCCSLVKTRCRCKSAFCTPDMLNPDMCCITLSSCCPAAKRNQCCPQPRQEVFSHKYHLLASVISKSLMLRYCQAEIKLPGGLWLSAGTPWAFGSQIWKSEDLRDQRAAYVRKYVVRYNIIVQVIAILWPQLTFVVLFFCNKYVYAHLKLHTWYHMTSFHFQVQTHGSHLVSHQPTLSI